MWGSWLYSLTLEIWLAKLVCWCQGIKLRVLTWNLEHLTVIREILRLPQKGYLVERHLSQDSWFPVLSAESEDGESWQRLNTLIHSHLRNFLTDPDLSQVIQSEIEALPQDHVWTQLDLIQLLLQIMSQGVFQRRLDLEEVHLLSQGIQSWRREISLKGPRQSVLKTRVWNWFSQQLQTTDPFLISSVAQPFFISPIINMTDLLVGCVRHQPRWVLPTQQNRTPIEKLLEVSYLEHPFPFLERYDSKTRTQYLIQLHPLPEPIPTSLPMELMFGNGPRACVGRQLALKILVPLVEQLVPDLRFQPELGHRYSGRLTQPQTWSEWWLETRTQIYRVGRMLCRLRRIP